jgi:hypothetical protein
MSPFETTFPGFVKAIGDLHQALLPFALVLLILGFVVEFWHGVPSPFELSKAFVKVFLVILLLQRSHDFINGGQQALQTWMERAITARPENVAQRFKEKLAEAQNARETEEESFLGSIFSARELFEGLIFAVLTLLAWAAMGAMALVYSVQGALLLAYWAISPLLFPLMTVRPLYGMGLRHLLRILGVMLWPIGLALAATFSEGLIDLIASGTSFADVSTGQAVGRGLASLLGVAILAIWILFSTFLAPLVIQRLLVDYDGSGAVLARTGLFLAHAMPTGAVTSSVSRASFHFGSAVSAVTRHLGGSSARVSSPVTPKAPTTSSSPTSQTTASSSARPAHDPAAETAARAITSRLKGE